MIESIKKLCRNREVDISLVPPNNGADLCIRAHYDHYGDYFRIDAYNIEYTRICGGMTIGDIDFVTATKDLKEFRDEWKFLHHEYGGSNLILRTAYSSSWADANPAQVFLIIADRIEVTAGADWESLVEMYLKE
jgi:hypothetical protein